MGTQELQHVDWGTFCERFTEMEKGDLVTLESMDSSGQRSDIARNISFQSIEFIRTKECSDLINVRFGEQPNGTIHQIVEPIHFRIKQDANGRKCLQIDGESGTTLVTFHSGRLEEALAGLHVN